MQIFFSIINSFEVSKGKGLPIGNLTSQYFANHYLSVADHYVKEELKVPAYVRYMDDMVLWHNDKNALLEIGKLFEIFIVEKLDLALKPFCLNNNLHGLPFLGYLLFDRSIKLAHRSKRRFIKKLTFFEEGLRENKYSQGEYQQHVLPLVSFTQQANSISFRKNVIEKLNGQAS